MSSSDGYSDDDFEDDFDDFEPVTSPAVASQPQLVVLASPEPEPMQVSVPIIPQSAPAPASSESKTDRLHRLTQATLKVQRAYRKFRAIVQRKRAEHLAAAMNTASHDLFNNLSKLKAIQEHKSGQNTTDCALCHLEPARLYCKNTDCHKSYCRLCSLAHHRNPTRIHHRQVLVSHKPKQNSDKDVDALCENCEDSMASLQCYSCDLQYCADCFKGIHGSRKYRHHYASKIKTVTTAKTTVVVAPAIVVGPHHDQTQVQESQCSNCDSLEVVTRCKDCDHREFCEACDMQWHVPQARQAHAREWLVTKLPTPTLPPPSQREEEKAKQESVPVVLQPEKRLSARERLALLEGQTQLLAPTPQVAVEPALERQEEVPAAAVAVAETQQSVVEEPVSWDSRILKHMERMATEEPDEVPIKKAKRKTSPQKHKKKKNKKKTPGKKKSNKKSVKKQSKKQSTASHMNATTTTTDSIRLQSAVVKKKRNPSFSATKTTPPDLSLLVVDTTSSMDESKLLDKESHARPASTRPTSAVPHRQPKASRLSLPSSSTRSRSGSVVAGNMFSSRRGSLAGAEEDSTATVHAEQLKFLVDSQRRKIKQMKSLLEQKDQDLQVLGSENAQLHFSLHALTKTHKALTKSSSHADRQHQLFRKACSKEVQHLQFMLEETKKAKEQLQQESTSQLNAEHRKYLQELEHEDGLHKNHRIELDELQQKHRAKLTILTTKLNTTLEAQKQAHHREQKNQELISQLSATKADLLDTVHTQEANLTRLADKCHTFTAVSSTLAHLETDYEGLNDRFHHAMGFMYTLQNKRQMYHVMMRKLAMKSFATQLFLNLRLRGLLKLLFPLMQMMLTQGVFQGATKHTTMYRLEVEKLTADRADFNGSLPSVPASERKATSWTLLEMVISKVNLLATVAKDLLPVAKFWRTKSNEYRHNNEKLRSDMTTLQMQGWKHEKLNKQLSRKLTASKKELKVLKSQLIHVELSSSPHPQDETAGVSTPANVVLRSSIGMAHALRNKQKELDVLNSQLKKLRTAVKSSKQELNRAMPRVNLQALQAKPNSDKDENNIAISFSATEVERPEADDLIKFPDNAKSSSSSSSGSGGGGGVSEEPASSSLTKFFLWDGSAGAPMPNPRKQQQQRQQQQRNHANVQRIYQGQGRIRNKRPSTARTSRPSTAGIRKKKKSSGGSVKRNTRPPSAALSRRDRTVHRALQKTFKQQPLPSREKRLKKKRAVTSVDFDVSASLSGDDEESADANIIQMNLDNGSSDTQSYDQDEMDLLSALN